MSARISSILMLSAVALLSVACSSPEPPPEPPPAPVAEAVPAKPHFVEAVAIQDALILGDLIAAQTAARQISSKEAPAGMGDRGSRIRTAAGAAAAATDLATVGEALGAMATQCGECHQEREAKIELELPRLPSHDPALKPHMARHAWAVNRLWEGLITGSGERWSKGLSALAEETIGPDHITGMDKLPETASGAAQRVHELAAEGLMATGGSDRQRIYSELVAACGTCHGFLGTGPKGAAAPE